jgi:PilZ domain
MTEKRHASRHKSFLRGYMYIGKSPFPVECLVRDISDTGARLKYSGLILASDIINLHIPNKGQILRAKVQWREAGEIGISFVSNSVVNGVASGDSDLIDRVARLEAEIAALKLIDRLPKNTDEKTDAA